MQSRMKEYKGLRGYQVDVAFVGVEEDKLHCFFVIASSSPLFRSWEIGVGRAIHRESSRCVYFPVFRRRVGRLVKLFFLTRLSARLASRHGRIKGQESGAVVVDGRQLRCRELDRAERRDSKHFTRHQEQMSDGVVIKFPSEPGNKKTQVEKTMTKKKKKTNKKIYKNLKDIMEEKERIKSYNFLKVHC